MKRKGIILAGGTGSRLHPSTIAVSKQLMPVYDKPMIYYPLSVLIQAGIRDIMIITTSTDRTVFELGDNLFFGSNFIKAVTPTDTENSGATVFGYQVEDPSAYGVVGFDSQNNVVSIIEKPEVPASNYAVTGLYFYDERAPEFAKQIRPSKRGELEITALNEIYLKNGELKVVLLDSDTTWLDTGTHRSLFEAAEFVKILVSRQGVRICCPEVESFRQGWISADALLELAKPLAKSGYGNYLKRIALGH